LPSTGPRLLHRIQRLLGPEVAVVAYQDTWKNLAAFVITSNTARVVPVATRAQISSWLGELATGIQERRLDDDTLAAGQQLLLAPLQEALVGSSFRIVVPTRRLAGVPFAALRDASSGRYWMEDGAIMTTPSLLSFVATVEHEGAAPGSSTRMVAVGDPDPPAGLSTRLPRLPYARSEAGRIAALYPDATLLLGPEATGQRFLEAAAGAAVVHFAGHAQSSSAASDGSWLSLPWQGGALDAEDLASQPWEQTSLFVLSACRGQGELLATPDDGGAGLARALLDAGVAVVVASAWEVQDAATLQLMLQLHDNVLSGLDPATALARAQRSALEDTEDRAGSDPWTWAAFRAIGGALPAVANDDRHRQRGH
jgi:CHAT domain-containing protein